MAYTTVERIMETYPRLATTQATSSTVSNFLEKGAAYIDSYIFSVVPSVPVVPTPPILRDLNEDLSYVMFLRRHVHDSGKESGIESVWKECVNRLENMRNGLITIVSSAGLEISNTSRSASPWTSAEGFVPTFGVGDIVDAEVDQDRIDSEEDAKK